MTAKGSSVIKKRGRGKWKIYQLNKTTKNGPISSFKYNLWNTSAMQRKILTLKQSDQETNWKTAYKCWKPCSTNTLPSYKNESLWHTYIFQNPFKTHSCFCLSSLKSHCKFSIFHWSNRLTVRVDILSNHTSAEVTNLCKFSNFKCSAHKLSSSVQYFVPFPSLSLSVTLLSSQSFSFPPSTPTPSSHVISQTFAPRLPAEGKKWLWLQVQTLCM